MQMKISSDSRGHYCIPKKIRRKLGKNPNFVVLANVGVIFPENANLEHVLESMKRIISEMKLLTETEQNNDMSE